MSLPVLSDAQIRAGFGEFRFENLPRGAVRILPDWAAHQLLQVEIPELAGVPSYGGPASGRVTCHRLVAGALRGAFAAIAAAGLAERIRFWGGSWVPRHKAWNPARGLSAHSWGIAIDINVQWNGYGVEPPPAGAEGSVVELVPLFERFGFAWGGEFSVRDGMHFEYARCPVPAMAAG